MKNAGFIIFLFVFSFGVNSFAAEEMDVSILQQQVKVLAEQKNFYDALVILDRAHQIEPENAEIILMQSRVLSWKGDYVAAQKILDTIYVEHSQDADIQLMQAYLHYYQGRREEAIALFQNILYNNPEYTDARAGLELAHRPLESMDEGYKWQIDAGYEHSNFSRRPQASWNQTFFQGTRFLNNRDTALHGKITRYDQFKTIDSEFELGVDHTFFPFLNTYLYGTVSPEADFRPDWRVMSGGAVRLLEEKSHLPAVWTTLDMRWDDYENTDVLNFNPGLRFEWGSGWAISGKAISVDQEDAKRVYGHEVRLDGQFKEGFRFNLVYADAPETVDEITVDTTTYSGGISYDLGSAYTLRIGYTHDDRDDSWARDVINASISYRF